MSEYEQLQTEQDDKGLADLVDGDLELDTESVDQVRGGFVPQPDPPGKPLES
jgi:hypothetical protein